MEILVNGRGDEWHFRARTTSADVYFDPCDPESDWYDEDDEPALPLLMPHAWRYRIRFNDQRDPIDSDCIPLGLWSEATAVDRA